MTKPEIPSECIRLQALLVALVQLPADLPNDLRRDINGVGKAIVNDRKVSIEQIKPLFRRSEIRQSYDQAYRKIRSRYEEKDKIKRPTEGSREKAQPSATDEETNVSLPATVVVESINRLSDILQGNHVSIPATVVVESIDKLSDILQGNVVENLRKSYDKFQANRPKNLTTDYYVWAECLCKL
ncbi:MAG: hypothetical protein SAJ37_00690 [Oscillatoria sp. PMC 1068.18]|nr:hypothetical protein [Oscillatoria sp. PMC 1076.18]MEC4987237.1 hypothetical protein [Oscillatoria sp. PMC 1068.18]